MIAPNWTDPFLYWAGLALFLQLGVTAEVLRGNRLMTFLRDVPPQHSPDACPWIAIIVAGRNEAESVQDALRTLLTLDYPHYEVVFVNDRSTDATGTLAEALIAEDSRLRVVHVTELPDGWLGKNHALWWGASHCQAQAQNGYYLFTDADIHFDPTTLRRAITRVQQLRLHHLAVSPHITFPGFWLKGFLGAFTIFFSMYARPWSSIDPKSPHGTGIGAFNLIEAAAYHALGGHQPLSLSVDDDMKLGRLIKRAGFRQEVVLGLDMVRVTWYRTVGEVVRGLEKNAFAGVDFKLSMIALSVFFQWGMVVAPYFGAVLLNGWPQWLCLATIALQLITCWDNNRFHGLSGWPRLSSALLYAGFVAFFNFIIVRSAWITLRQNGITWRGTHYPLSQLKAGVARYYAAPVDGLAARYQPSAGLPPVAP